MKNLILSNILILGLLLSLSFCSQAQDAQKYGESIEAKGAVALKKLPKKLQSEDQVNIKLKGEVLETCKMKGCWMTLDMGNGESMRVSFKDYGFFVPKEGVGGKQAIVEGVAKREEIDVATLQHYAEDAGKSQEEIEAITKPEVRYTFEAVGVIIR